MFYSNPLPPPTDITMACSIFIIHFLQEIFSKHSLKNKVCFLSFNIQTCSKIMSSPSIWSILASLACTLWHKVTVYNYPACYTATKGSISRWILHFARYSLHLEKTCWSLVPANLPTWVDKATSEREEKVTQASEQRWWWDLQSGAEGRGHWVGGEAWSNDHMELARSCRKCRGCSGYKTIHVLVISVAPAGRRLWLNPPHFFHPKILYVKRQDTIYAYCFRNTQDRGKHHLWRSEIEGVTSATIGSRSGFGSLAAAPAVNAEMCSGPWH